jgi:hypothetical protein
VITSVRLIISTQLPPVIDALTPVTPVTSTQPFVRVDGVLADTLPGPSIAYSAT